MKTFSRVSPGHQFQFNVFTLRRVHRLFSFIAEAPDFSTTIRYFEVVGPALAAPASQSMTSDDVMWWQSDVTSYVECQEVEGDPFLGGDRPSACLMWSQVRFVEGVVRVDVSRSFGSPEGASTETCKNVKLITWRDYQLTKNDTYDT